jgi:uncharacterized protein (TIGR00369 family)
LPQYEYEIFKPFDPNFENRVRGIFGDAPFVAELGFVPLTIAPGAVVTELQVAKKHAQQNGFVHAGVLATIADHTAGAAAATLIFAGKIVLTAEFKINLLRPAKGEKVICEAFVLKNGKTLIITDSFVYTATGTRKKLVARATVTLAVVAV